MSKSELVTITLERSALLGLFAGGNYDQNNSPLSLSVARNALHHAYEILSAINSAHTNDGIGDVEIWYAASQLSAADALVAALHQAEVAASTSSSEHSTPYAREGERANAAE